jgi:hypothetical protein
MLACVVAVDLDSFEAQPKAASAAAVMARMCFKDVLPGFGKLNWVGNEPRMNADERRWRVARGHLRFPLY